MSGRETITFESNLLKQVERKRRREKNLAQKYPISADYLLALAHDIQTRIESGEFRDYAEVARHHQLIRPYNQQKQLIPTAHVRPDHSPNKFHH